MARTRCGVSWNTKKCNVSVSLVRCAVLLLSVGSGELGASGGSFLIAIF